MNHYRFDKSLTGNFYKLMVALKQAKERSAVSLLEARESYEGLNKKSIPGDMPYSYALCSVVKDHGVEAVVEKIKEIRRR